MNKLPILICSLLLATGLAHAACFNNIQNIPATCDGTITQNTILSSGCRSITCTNGADNTNVLACDKPDGTAQYFEMYLQSVAGRQRQICVGDTCLSGGFAKSKNYPYCTPDSPPIPPTPSPTPSSCGVQNLQASCVGGTVTGDSVQPSGCRSVKCQGGSSAAVALACNKPTETNPTSFEMYLQAQSGEIQVCLSGTCVGKESGFASSSFPSSCTGSPIPPTSPPSGCFATIQGIPATCSGGAITADTTFSSGCRSITCSSGANTLQVFACPKPSDINPQYFEMYKQMSAGSPPQICIGSTCLQHDGFAKSGTVFCSGTSPPTTPPTTPSPGGSTPWTTIPGYKVDLVASNINLPVNIQMAPTSKYLHLPQGNRPMLYITQLYGKIGVIRNDGSYSIYAENLLNYDPTAQGIPGIGEMGVDGLYVDPNTGTLFVSMTYADHTSPTGFSGKVDRFISNANGDGYTSRTTIISGIIAGPSHAVHTITRGPDGKLYLNTGDAALYDSSLLWMAQDKTSPVGKVLRFNDDGSIPIDNPIPGKYFWAGGLRNPFGGSWQPGTMNYFVAGPGTHIDDGIYKATRGVMFGWCCDLKAGAWYNWPVNVAPVQIAFDTGIAGFGTTGTLYVGLSGHTYQKGKNPFSKRIQQFSVTPSGGVGGTKDIAIYDGSGYGTVIGMTFAPQGLFFTDIYGEQGFVAPGVTQGNIYLLHRT